MRTTLHPATQPATFTVPGQRGTKTHAHIEHEYEEILLEHVARDARQALRQRVLVGVDRAGYCHSSECPSGELAATSLEVSPLTVAVTSQLVWGPCCTPGVHLHLDSSSLSVVIAARLVRQECREVAAGSLSLNTWTAAATHLNGLREICGVETGKLLRRVMEEARLLARIVTNTPEQHSSATHTLAVCSRILLGRASPAERLTWLAGFEIARSEHYEVVAIERARARALRNTSRALASLHGVPVQVHQPNRLELTLSLLEDALEPEEVGRLHAGALREIYREQSELAARALS